MNSAITFFVCLLAIIGVLVVPAVIILRRSHLNKKVAIILYFFTFIFILRFAVNCFGMDPDEGGSLNLFEKLSDSFLHTLQTFSMDEGYTEYTVTGKELISGWGYSSLAAVYGAVVSVLNVCAPIAGGALLLEILTGVFPSLRLACHPFRSKYVFSEMNEHGILLAEDIYRQDKDQQLMELDRKLFFRPLILFTDAYLDDETEMSSELFERAKAIGAICVKKDLLHLRLRRSNNICYLLMDVHSSKNVSAFAKLMELNGPDSGDRLWPVGNAEQRPAVRVYIFVKDTMESGLVSRIRKNFPETDANILVRCIRDDATAVLNLVDSIPLYLPYKIAGKQPKSINVSVIGGSGLAAEVLKTSYWVGQIPNTVLNLRLVSRNAKEIEEDLKMTCPELIASCEEFAPLLKLCQSPDDDRYNPPYARLSFEAVASEERLTDYPKEILEDTDYYVIAAGADETNIAIAENLRMVLSRKLAAGEKTGRKIIIAAAVFDDSLAGAVGQDRIDGSMQPVICTFGMAGVRYSCQNVFMIRRAADAKSTHELYSRASSKKETKDEYGYWSTIARVIHAQYKLFGIAYSGGQLTQDERLLLTWNEHRRWNAYLRSQGFTCADEKQHQWLYDTYGAHKGLLEKLHPCLVESALIPEPFDHVDQYDAAKHDMLDMVSMQAYRMESESGAITDTFPDSYLYYKKYDDPYAGDSEIKAMAAVN